MFRLCCVMREGVSLSFDREDVTLQGGDLILLAGRADSIDVILSTDGMELASLKGAHVRQFAKRAVDQVEVVVANRCPGVGQSIADFDFFGHYGAVVLAVHRDGEVVTQGIGSHILEDGDTLILMTDGNFTKRWGESSAFYLVAQGEELQMPVSGAKRWFGLAFVSIIVIGATFGERILPPHIVNANPMFYFVSMVMVGMALTGLFPAKRYTKFIGWDIIIAIASAFAISKALSNTGIAESIATFINGFSALFGPYGALVMLYLITMILTELITNAAAVAIAFPVAMSASEMLGVNPLPFFVAICVAAASSFSSPIGYQVNLIVQGVGGYKVRDFLRVGLPLNLIIMAISLLLIPIIWRF